MAVPCIKQQLKPASFGNSLMSAVLEVKVILALASIGYLSG